MRQYRRGCKILKQKYPILIVGRNLGFKIANKFGRQKICAYLLTDSKNDIALKNRY